MGSSTENSAFGPSHNPWDPTRVPGGSGGGSAAAVSGGLAPWALGSDTGGSIKQPSALCGNVGLRPTYGTVSRYGVVAFASSLDETGQVAKNVRDCALLYSIIAGRDPRDATTVELPEPVELPTAERLDGLRIGVPKEVEGLGAIEPGVRVAFDHAIAHARELGAEIGECDLPLSFEYGMACYYLVAPAEASSNLARYDGVRYGQRVAGSTYRDRKSTRPNSSHLVISYAVFCLKKNTYTSRRSKEWVKKNAETEYVCRLPINTIPISFTTNSYYTSFII